MNTRLAVRLEAGDVVGFSQGRAEFGPRALGARSILADARSPEMQRRLNLKIKFRESFRPFAPIVLAERASEYFDLPAPSPYMLFTAPVAANRRSAACHIIDDKTVPAWAQRLMQVRSEIPAVTHVDFSARGLQLAEPIRPRLGAEIGQTAQHRGDGGVDRIGRRRMEFRRRTMIEPQHGWRPGAQLEVEDRGDEVVLKSLPDPRGNRVEDLLGMLPFRGAGPKSLAEMDAAISRGARPHRGRRR